MGVRGRTPLFIDGPEWPSAHDQGGGTLGGWGGGSALYTYSAPRIPALVLTGPCSP